MSRRARILSWSISCIALLGLLFWAYRRFVFQQCGLWWVDDDEDDM